jgi:hypothetical protein
MNGFERMLSVVAGFAGVILFSNMVELDWQLVLMALRDATYGGWVPEFSIEFDLNKLRLRS